MPRRPWRCCASKPSNRDGRHFAGDQPRVVHIVDGSGADELDGVVGGTLDAGIEGCEGMHRPERTAVPRGDAVVLSLDVRHHHRAGMVEQVGDDDTDALARAGRREGQQVARPVEADKASAILAEDNAA